MRESSSVRRGRPGGSIHNRIDTCVGARAAPRRSAGAVQYEQRLLLGALQRHKAHRGPGDRLADRRRIVGIVLLPREVGLDEPRGHQSHRAPHPLQLSPPVVRRRTGFHAHQAGRQLGKKLCQLLTLDRPLQHYLTARIHPVHLKHLLRQVQSNRANVHADALTHVMWKLQRSTLAHLMPYWVGASISSLINPDFLMPNRIQTSC